MMLRLISSATALLLGGGGDLLVHRLDVRHRAGDVLQGHTGLARQLDAAVGQARLLFITLPLAGCRSAAGHQAFDFFGGLLRTLGQAAHFVGDHGKTTAGFTGARRFNGRVERQQVGLFGHGLDHVHHAADLVAFLLQRAMASVERATSLARRSIWAIASATTLSPSRWPSASAAARRPARRCARLPARWRSFRAWRWRPGRFRLLAVDPGAGLFGHGRHSSAALAIWVTPSCH
jgi:hypothetical protein